MASFLSESEQTAEKRHGETDRDQHTSHDQEPSYAPLPHEIDRRQGTCRDRGAGALEGARADDCQSYAQHHESGHEQQHRRGEDNETPTLVDIRALNSSGGPADRPWENALERASSVQFLLELLNAVEDRCQLKVGEATPAVAVTPRHERGSDPAVLVIIGVVRDLALRSARRRLHWLRCRHGAGACTGASASVSASA